MDPLNVYVQKECPYTDPRSPGYRPSCRFRNYRDECCGTPWNPPVCPPVIEL